MTNLVPAEDIERIVGVDRHPTLHLGRMVPADQMVYILHSRECLESGGDLRECLFSLALDNGLERDSWANHKNVPVALGISDGLLEALGAWVELPLSSGPNQPEAKESPEAFARRVLAMTEAVAVGFLEQWHASTCECGQAEDGRMLLESIRRHWDGRL